MMTTRDTAIWYLRNCTKGTERVSLFQEFTSNGGQRDGQAFMNCLPTGEFSRLTDSPVDPFYKDGNIPAAVDLLTTKENT